MKALFICLMLTASSLSWATQSTRPDHIDSEYLEESRKILVRLPADYSTNPTKTYPILITLNDEDNFKWASNIVDIQSSKFGIEDMIVVGLPHAGDYTMDNYPFKAEDSVEKSPQAQNYIKFIIEEALPHLNQNYRTNGGQFIIGHSLSGLLVTSMFMQYPNTFSTFIALSPSVHHAPQLSTTLETFFKQNRNLSGSLYMSLGDLEHQQIQKEYQSLKQVFEQLAPTMLKWSVNYMQNTDHMLAAYKGTYDGLAWIYSDWSIKDIQMQTYRLENYIQHYKTLSQQLKYTIKPRQKYLAGFSWFAENKLNNRPAAIEAIKAAIYFYPSSQTLKDTLLEYESKPK